MNNFALVHENSVPNLTPEMYANISIDVLNSINIFLANKALYYSKSNLYGYVVFLPRAFMELKVNSISDVTDELLADWLITYSKGKANQTIANKVAMLSCFFSFFLNEDIISKNPVLRRFRCKVPLQSVRSLDETEYQKVRREAEKLPLLNRAIFEVFDSSGMRRRELIDLKVKNIDLENKKATVTGKGNKTRVVPLSELAVILLLKIINPKNNNEYVFMVEKGQQMYRLSSWTVWSMIYSLGKKAGLKISLFPHRLRHGLASRLYYQGVPIVEIQKILGHEDTQTTLRYIDAVPESVQNFYDKAMNKK